MIGKTLGKYHIVGQLGRGATGLVYKAIDETLNREVAIKILNPDIADTDIMKRFRAEATILAKLNHPEIATIYELVRSEADLLMVMEFVRGETLEKLSDRLAPMPPDRAAYLIDRILSALEHAHRAGVVHRDMKPTNMMVTDVGGVKIMDFGIARVRGVERMTIDGCMMGTPAYMPPEQVLGEEVDGRADLYSVGVVFYRLLTGALPFTAHNAIGMLQKQISETPMPLHLNREGLPGWCETIVRRALAKSPADRFQTAEEFRESLGRATGMMVTIDLAKAFAVAETEGISTPAQPAPAEILALSPVEATIPEAVSASGVITSRHAPAMRTPLPVAAPAGGSSTAVGATIVLRKKHFEWTRSRVAALAAGVAILAAITLHRPATQFMTAGRASTFPALVFDAKALVATGGRQRERDARLLLADGKVTVSTDADRAQPLHSVPYGNVTSISYSRSRDPMWNSPKGPAPVARMDGGALGILGISVQRHWISLQTNTDDTKNQFVVLHLNDALVREVLSALEERTGRTPQIIGQRTGSR